MAIRNRTVPTLLALIPALALSACLGSGQDTDPPLITPDLSTPLWFWRGGSDADDSALAITSLNDLSLVISGRSGGDYQGNYNRGTPGYLDLDDDVAMSRLSGGSSLWDRLHGSSADDHSRAIGTDGNGNLFLAVTSSGYFNGHPNLGGEDSFLVKTDGNGDISWSVAIASTGNDSITDMVFDGSGGQYVTGYTRGNLPGNVLRGSEGYADWFVAHVSGAGSISWIITGGTAATDLPEGLARDASGNLLLTGYSWGAMGGYSNQGNADIFVSKINPTTRTVTWTRMSGSSQSDFAWDVLTDVSNNVYVSGSRAGHALVEKYNSSGTLQWSREIPAASPGSEGRALAFYGSQLLLAGDTVSPSLDGFNTAGSNDIFLCTLNTDGLLLDTELYGGGNADFAYDLLVSGGQVFVAGSAAGTFYNNAGQGLSDALVMRVR